MNTTTNHHHLSADIRAISEEIRALKRVLRRPWLRPMASEQRALLQLAARATELCALKAFTRNRFHLKQAPRHAPSDWTPLWYHQRIFDRLGPSYAVALEQSA